MDWKWFVDPYVDVESLMYGLSAESKEAIMEAFYKGCIDFNEEAIKSISNQVKTMTSYTVGPLQLCCGILKWCGAHSPSPKESLKKFGEMVGEKVLLEIKKMMTKTKDT